MELGMLLWKKTKHQEVMDELGRHNLNFTPSVDKLVKRPAKMQSLYRDRNKIGFDGTLVDFVCAISAFERVHMLHEFSDFEPSMCKSVYDGLIKIEMEFVAGDPDLRNMLRLAGNRPDILLHILKDYMNEDEAKEVILYLVKMLAELKMKEIGLSEIILDDWRSKRKT